MRRIGYAALDYDFWFPDTSLTVSLELTAEPLAQELPEIVVEGEMMILGGRRLAGFERRRKSGPGRYLTERDIEKIDPKVTSDILRRVPGVIVRPTPTGTSVDLQGSGTMCAAPVIFVDGIRIVTDDVDFALLPESIVGIEVYRSGGTLPPEFTIIGAASSANCGVIAFWTR